MNKSEKVLKLLSNFVETGILTSQDAKKELINNLKFRRDNLIDKLQLISREEFETVSEPIFCRLNKFIFSIENKKQGLY